MRITDFTIIDQGLSLGQIAPPELWLWIRHWLRAAWSRVDIASTRRILIYLIISIYSKIEYNF